MKVNSYDRNARRPKVGSMWVWEPSIHSARALIEVVEVKWNGEGWWVKTKTLLPSTFYNFDENKEIWNSLSRFFEACVPVLTKLDDILNIFTEKDKDGNED